MECDIRLTGMTILPQPKTTPSGATYYANFNVVIGPVIMLNCALTKRAMGKLDWQVPVPFKKNGGGKSGIVVNNHDTRAQVMRLALNAYDALGVNALPDEVWAVQG